MESPIILAFSLFVKISTAMAGVLLNVYFSSSSSSKPKTESRIKERDTLEVCLNLRMFSRRLFLYSLLALNSCGQFYMAMVTPIVMASVATDTQDRTMTELIPLNIVPNRSPISAPLSEGPSPIVLL